MNPGVVDFPGFGDSAQELPPFSADTAGAAAGASFLASECPARLAAARCSAAAAWSASHFWKSSGVSTVTKPFMRKWPRPQSSAHAISQLPTRLPSNQILRVHAGDRVLLDAELGQEERVDDVLRRQRHDDGLPDREVELVERQDVVGGVELAVRPRIADVPGELLGRHLDLESLRAACSP